MATGFNAVTTERLPDLAALFDTNGTTRSCYCMWFVAPMREVRAGWTGGNRLAFEQLTGSEDVPMGILAYNDGEPVGWCAVGPRSRYARAMGLAAHKERDAAHDDQVWLVPCFFVRVGFRRQGVMRELLDRAVALARDHGAMAVEGFPLAGGERKSGGDAYLGVEPLFAAAGFAVIARPTSKRVVMRLEF